MALTTQDINCVPIHTDSLPLLPLTSEIYLLSVKVDFRKLLWRLLPDIYSEAEWILDPPAMGQRTNEFLGERGRRGCWTVAWASAKTELRGTDSGPLGRGATGKRLQRERAGCKNRNSNGPPWQFRVRSAAFQLPSFVPVPKRFNSYNFLTL